jgi:hypothetical protein
MNREEEKDRKKEKKKAGKGKERTTKRIKKEMIKNCTVYATQPQHLIQHGKSYRKTVELKESK